MNKGMITATIIMAVLSVILVSLGYFRGEGQHLQGLKSGWRMTIEVLPLLIFAFIVAGMVQTLIPHESIARWIGNESGFRGILIGCLAGGLTPGGPFVSLPLVAGLYRSGASVGTTIAYLTAWSLWAFSRLPLEFGVLGVRLTVVRLVCTFIFPILAGLLAQLFFSKWAS